jgi:hypothetical protein
VGDGWAGPAVVLHADGPGFRLHTIALVADRWADDVRLSDVEPRFVCTACGKRGAEVRPNFEWNARGAVGGMGYRVVADV